MASALRHNKRRLRFIRSPHCISVYLTTGRAKRPRAHCRHPMEHNVWTQAAFPSEAILRPGKLEATALNEAPAMLRAIAMLLGEVA
jgi:hypothetical protein